MPLYVINGTPVHVKLSGKAKKNPPKPCCARVGNVHPTTVTRRCMAISTHLCDWPVEGGGTCDAPLCEEHAHQVAADRHYCPIHQALHRQRDPELF